MYWGWRSSCGSGGNDVTSVSLLIMNSELTIRKIGIIGAGTMGNGIAHVSALSGFDTILVDTKDEFIHRGLNTIRNNLKRQIKKDVISQAEMDASLERIEIATSPSQMFFRRVKRTRTLKESHLAFPLTLLKGTKIYLLLKNLKVHFIRK